MTTQLLDRLPAALRGAPPVCCLECDYRGHALDRHALEAHGLTMPQYRERHPEAPFRSAIGDWLVGNMPAHPVSVSSLEAFGVGGGRDGARDMPLRGYRGYGPERRVPQADAGYVFPERVTRDVLMGMSTGEFVYLHGPTGSGKSTLPQQIAARLGRPFYPVQFYDGMEPADLHGTWLLGEGREMRWGMAAFAQGLATPGAVVLLDEFDSGNPTVSAIANAVLCGEPLEIPQTGERVAPAPDVVIVATGNTNGMGDETGLYNSTRPQSFATMDRFAMFVEVGYMAAADEERMLAGRFPRIAENAPSMLRQMVEVAGKVRQSFKAGDVGVVISTRKLIHWAKWFMCTGDVHRAFMLAFGGRLGEDDFEKCAEIYQRVVGERPGAK